MSSSAINLRVRYSELAGDHVYYANYFAWLEAGLTSFYKTHDLPFLGYEHEGVKTMVAESYARFVKPARYDDQVRVTSTLAAAAPKRVLFEHTVQRDGETLLQAGTTHVLLHGGNDAPQPFSEDVMSLANERAERVNVLEKSDEALGAAPSDAFCVVTEIPVRYRETDPAGVVYFSNHYVYFEVGRTELFRAAGLSFTDLKAGGLRMPVSKAYCKYLAPAAYGDAIALKTWISNVSKVRLTFRYELRAHPDGSPIASGFTIHGCLNEQGRAQRVPEPVARLAHA